LWYKHFVSAGSVGNSKIFFVRWHAHMHAHTHKHARHPMKQCHLTGVRIVTVYFYRQFIALLLLSHIASVWVHLNSCTSC
jgi:hypothetical protein